MKTIWHYVALMLISLTASNLSAQNNWTWMNGNNAANASPAFGTLGVPSTTNNPGSRVFPCYVTDAAGNLWLFGGDCANTGYMADLWRYSPSTGQWTWVKGPNSANTNAVYGTQGVSSPSNNPGGRQVAIGWADNNGNIWIFGGTGYASSSFGLLNDLWRYNISSNEWTWMKGSITTGDFGTYGTQGIGTPSTTPGSRTLYGSAKDQAGNLLLFGGYGNGVGSLGKLNDLWKYDINNNTWIWLKGSQNPDQFASFGTLGVTASTVSPGATEQMAMTTDVNGNVWMFAGYGFQAGTVGYSNALWKYNPATNNWTWMSGSTNADAPGVFGTPGVPSTTVVPGSRDGHGIFTEASGNILIFGGYGYCSNTPGMLNDLWRYNTSTGAWTWVNGSSSVAQNGVYGTLGVGSSSNIIGGRYAFGYWTQGTNLWIYGGNGFYGSGSGDLNDLWKYNNSSSATSLASSTANIQEPELYPNPTYDAINVRVDKPSLIEVLNTMGEEVTTIKTDKTVSIDMTSFSSGMYLVRIQQDGCMKTTRVFKN